MENDKVSVIIASYNRFTYLMNTIQSIKAQTYQNVEIIVVNDCSTQPEYYTFDFESNGVKIINLEKNSKEIHGFACPGGYQRNFGMEIASGKYIAFCDDDDIWFPHKLTMQIDMMKKSGCKMSCTEALIGSGVFNRNKQYKRYNADYAFNYINKIYQIQRVPLIKNGNFRVIWDLAILKINNCCVCSSVVIEKSVIETSGDFKSMKTADDYDYWLRVLEHTNCVYIAKPCVYYDSGHGDGQNYKAV
jgi:teichuronic acid biosynthesis glycosyltransferase TuaG